MIRKPRFKVCRRVGDRIFAQCQTARYSTSLAKRADKKRSRGGFGKSDFGAQLVEKQKMRFMYGVNERQFSNYVKKARMAGGQHVTEKLFELLEMRLDNVTYRMGLTESQAKARVLVAHGHILVNGRRVTVPSYSVKVGDIVSIRKESMATGMFSAVTERMKNWHHPSWMKFDDGNLAGKIVAVPQASELVALGMNLNSIIEFYSR